MKGAVDVWFDRLKKNDGCSRRCQGHEIFTKRGKGTTLFFSNVFKIKMTVVGVYISPPIK